MEWMVLFTNLRTNFMARNFRISSHRNSDNLHLRLEGDFDGSSAHQLLNFLKKNIKKNSKIFIHTNCLKAILPFGRDVFQNQIDFVTGDTGQLVFTGAYANQIKPKMMAEKIKPPLIGHK
jgi:hypothetical protein